MRFGHQSARARHAPRGLRLVVLHANPHQLVHGEPRGVPDHREGRDAFQGRERAGQLEGHLVRLVRVRLHEEVLRGAP